MSSSPPSLLTTTPLARQAREARPPLEPPRRILERWSAPHLHLLLAKQQLAVGHVLRSDCPGKPRSCVQLIARGGQWLAPPSSPR
mmetsp:Transcript_4123/g.17326  ORF Transcript_4123/g.17326 Transcript_4123/m.17326 type:complete len:85 (-) Transcript_4123:432-686(-)